MLRRIFRVAATADYILDFRRNLGDRLRGDAPWRNGSRARLDTPDGAHSGRPGPVPLGIPDGPAVEKRPLRRLDHHGVRRKISENAMCNTISPASSYLDGMVPWILAAGSEHTD